MTQAIGNKILHAPGEISVHHHGIGSLGAAWGADADRASAIEEDLFNRFVEADFHAEALRNAGHGSGDRGASANRMINAVFVFEEAQDAKKARATEWRHSEIFRLEAKRQTNPVIGKEAF